MCTGEDVAQLKIDKLIQSNIKKKGVFVIHI